MASAVAERRKAAAPPIEGRAAAQAAIGEQCAFRRFASLLRFFAFLTRRGGEQSSDANTRRENEFVYPPPRSGGGGPCEAWWRGHAALRLAAPPRPLPPPFGRSPSPLRGRDKWLVIASV